MTDFSSLQPLAKSPDRYFKNSLKKDKIFLHHTAGSYNPQFVIDGWNNNPLRLGTAYVIGRANPNAKKNDPSLDGQVLKFFEDNNWAYHLGIKEVNYAISKSSIGIEMCNWGPLTPSENEYITYTHSEYPHGVPILNIKDSFRGYYYFEMYTEKQIASLKDTILYLANKYSIDVRAGIQKLIDSGSKAFDVQQSALAGKPGLWTHVNVRADKMDCSPQPILIDMIKSL